MLPRCHVERTKSLSEKSFHSALFGRAVMRCFHPAFPIQIRGERPCVPVKSEKSYTGQSLFTDDVDLLLACSHIISVVEIESERWNAPTHGERFASDLLAHSCDWKREIGRRLHMADCDLHVWRVAVTMQLIYGIADLCRQVEERPGTLAVRLACHFFYTLYPR